MAIKKNAFLIIRLPDSLKKDLLKKAKDAGENISVYVRSLLEKVVK